MTEGPDLAKTLMTASQAYTKTRDSLREARSGLESLQGGAGYTANKATTKLRALENGVDDAVLSFFRSCSQGRQESESREALERVVHRCSAVEPAGQRLQAEGRAELCSAILARLSYRTMNPYLHRDELLDQLEDARDKFARLAAELKGLSA